MYNLTSKETGPSKTISYQLDSGFYTAVSGANSTTGLLGARAGYANKQSLTNLLLLAPGYAEKMAMQLTLPAEQLAKRQFSTICACTDSSPNMCMHAVLCVFPTLTYFSFVCSALLNRSSYVSVPSLGLLRTCLVPNVSLYGCVCSR